MESIAALEFIKPARAGVEFWYGAGLLLLLQWLKHSMVFCVVSLKVTFRP